MMPWATRSSCTSVESPGSARRTSLRAVSDQTTCSDVHAAIELRKLGHVLGRDDPRGQGRDHRHTPAHGHPGPGRTPGVDERRHDRRHSALDPKRDRVRVGRTRSQCSVGKMYEAHSRIVVTAFKGGGPGVGVSHQRVEAGRRCRGSASGHTCAAELEPERDATTKLRPHSANHCALCRPRASWSHAQGDESDQETSRMWHR